MWRVCAAAKRRPKLSGELPDDERPKLMLVVERADDAVEQEPDPQRPEKLRPEVLALSLFTSAGTLESGRASFLDLDCPRDPQDCPQQLRSHTLWQPPAARAPLEVPDDRAYFFLVLRDDRGGLSFRAGSALALP